MKHHLITVAILLAALAFYGLGMAQLGAAGIVIGGAFELWFWVRLISALKPKIQNAKRQPVKSRHLAVF